MLLALLLIGFSSAELDWSCPFPWELTYSSNSFPHCHRVVQGEIFSHSEAQHICNEHNGSLSVLQDNSQIAFFNDLIKRGWRISQELPFSDRVWIAHEKSMNSSDCSALLPDRKSGRAIITTIPCDLRTTAGNPVKHVFCQMLSEKTEKSSTFCEAGWSKFTKDETCHKLFKVGVSSYDGARAFCAAHDSNVSILDTFQKKSFAQKLMTSGWRVKDEGVPQTHIYVGLSLVRKRDEPMELSSDSGKVIDDFKMFKPSEPYGGSFHFTPCILMNPLENDQKGGLGAFMKFSCDHWQLYENKDEIVKHVLCERKATSNKQDTRIERKFDNKKNSCDDSWEIFENKCHKLIPVGITTATGAEAICRANGAKLSSLKSQEEIEFITDYMSQGPKISGSDTFYTNVWIGLNRDSDGVWKWNDGMELGKNFSAKKNRIDSSDCAAFLPLNVVNKNGEVFGEVPCDTALIDGFMMPPSHVLCEKDHNRGILSNFVRSAKPCPKSWHFLDENRTCIKIFAKTTYSFIKAQSDCNMEGGNLVSIDTPRKRDFIIDLTTRGWRQRFSSIRASWMVIGLRKDGDYTWRWTNGAELNSSLFLDATLSNCVTMAPTKYGTYKYAELDAAQCENDINLYYDRFICEKEAEKERTSLLTLVLLVSPLLGVVVVGIVCFNCWSRKRYHRRLSSENKDRRLFDAGSNLDVSIMYQELDPIYKISAKSVLIEEEIGNGFFGRVYKGKLLHPKKKNRTLDVAVKKLRDSEDDELKEVLLMETKLLCSLGTHPNVIAGLGAVISRDARIQYLLMELCTGGNLKDHLFSQGHLIEESEQISFSFQIANGMLFLSTIPCLHRDLAARNILLTNGKLCKIADFGLAKFNHYYRSHTPRSLPYKWMSPEAIESNRFSTKSDVWSFGIVLFEIFSFGSTPYANVPPNEVISVITRGLKNQMPQTCPKEISELANNCWHMTAAMRPTFAECHAVLKELLSTKFSKVWEELTDDLEKSGQKQFSYKEWLPATQKK